MITITQVEVSPGDYPGTYWVTVNDDPEHELSQSCVSRQAALDIMVEINQQMAEEALTAPRWSTRIEVRS